MANQQPQIDYDRLAAEVTGMAPSQQQMPPASGVVRPEQIGAAHDPNYVGDDPDLGTRALANAPTAGAMLGGLLGGIPGAAVGGAVGALLRGDSIPGAVYEGGKQGALQLGGGMVVKGLQKVARGLMRGTVPKNIAKDFDDVDIGKEMLDRGVVPGSARSARRVEGLSRAANTERDAAAATVPPMSRSKVVAGIRPIHQRAVTGRVPQMSEDALAFMRQSARDIGPTPLSGPEALARKDIQQSIGRATTNAANPRQAAFGPQLHDAERAAIVSHLRETPRMARALDESQALMAIDKVMKDAAHSNIVTRSRVGGAIGASMTPLGIGATAHAVNQGAHVFNPQVVRLLDLILRSGSHE